MRWKAPSMPTDANDLKLLDEQETPLVIGKTWFLDQKIPAGGFRGLRRFLAKGIVLKHSLSRIQG